MMFAGETIELTSLDGQPLKIHLISTGAVKVKTRFRETTRTGFAAQLSFILERKFTGWMPIWVMVIEHPEGIYVIDTGENANINDPGYFRSSGFFASWFDTTQFKFSVSREEEIDRQLQSLNIHVEKIKAVVLTHLHLDHADGLRHFQNVPVIVSEAEWKRPFGDLPKLYPHWFKPILVKPDKTYDVFKKAHYLTEKKDLILVETPGHTWHHCSVILKTKQCDIFFAADICYSQDQLIYDKYSGSNASHRLAKMTYAAVKAYCGLHKTIFVPSHETAASRRLKSLQPVPSISVFS